jgi:hypothetical protein
MQDDRSARSQPSPTSVPSPVTEAEPSAALADLSARVDAVAVQALAWREHAEKLRAAVSWLEQPFVDEDTPEREIRQRIAFMIADAERADALLDQALNPSAADTAERIVPAREESK